MPSLEEQQLQFKLQQQQLALEEKQLKSLTLQGARTKGIADQRKLIGKLSQDLNKSESSILKVEVELERLSKSRAAQYKTLTLLGGTFMGLVGKTQDLLKKGSDNISNTRSTLGINTNEAKKMNGEILKQLKGTNLFNSNLQDATSAMADLNEAFGGALQMTAEAAVNLDIASKKLGISTKEAATFQQMMFQSGEASQEVAINTMAGLKSLSQASGVKFDVVMKDIAGSGKDMMNYFGKSAKEIGIMAVQARKMGFELSDMKTMSEGLLDVEGRIEKQMKFNMLTGKKINMDKATSLLLAGDEIGAMQEIQTQVGNTKDLSIQERKVLEDMLGINLGKLENAKQLAAAKKEDAAAAAELAGIEQQLRDGQLAEFEAKQLDREAAVTSEERRMNFEQTMMDNAAHALTQSEKQNQLALILQGIQMVISGVMAAQAVSSSLKAATEQASLGSALKAVPALVAGGIANMGKAVGSIFSSLAAIPFGLGIPIAIAAVAGMFMLGKQAVNAFSMADGVIGPDGGMMVSGPKGSIQLDKQDSIIAGTNLGGGSGGGGKSIDIRPLLAKMDQLILAVRTSKQLSVDGYQLNEAVNLEKVPAGMA